MVNVNNIKTVNDLLNAIKNKGVVNIEHYLNIKHNPTIGNMYEGLTKEIISRALFEGLNIKVVSGKITNKEKKYSNQIDCMVVFGEGEKIPYTEDYIYDINQVIMVIEVKKNLFSNELADSYKNLSSVKEVQWNNYRELRKSITEDSFAIIVKEPLPALSDINKMNYQKQMLYHTLVMESLLPLRVVFGFNSFVSEQSLREKFIEYLQKQALDNGGKGRGYGPYSFPSLIIAGNNSIVKTNGMPYVFDTDVDDEYCWLASYRREPLLLLLELLWTRLTQQYDLPVNVFGDELQEEALAPLLKMRALENGWAYNYYALTQEQLDAYDNLLKRWAPASLDEDEFSFLNVLCNGYTFTKDELRNQVGEKKTEAIIKKLNKERLIYVDNDNEIQLLTKACKCVIDPEYGYLAADDYDDRFSKWLIKRMYELKREKMK